MFGGRKKISLRLQENGNQVDGEVLQHERMKTSICPRYNNFRPLFPYSNGFMTHTGGKYNLAVFFPSRSCHAFSNVKIRFYNMSLPWLDVSRLNEMKESEYAQKRNLITFSGSFFSRTFSEKQGKLFTISASDSTHINLACHWHAVSILKTKINL